MKKLILFFAFFILSSVPVIASEDYDSLYEKALPFPSRLYNDIDPYEDEDALKYAWSPYPLFRTAADLYFKDYKIDSGYYILTPRTLKGDDYILFKQNGKVVFIIPVAKKENTPVNFYDANVPKMKQTAGQKFAAKIRNTFYKTAKDSMKAPPPDSLIDVEVDGNYVIIKFYYGPDKYTLLFKRSPY